MPPSGFELRTLGVPGYDVNHYTMVLPKLSLSYCISQISVCFNRRHHHFTSCLELATSQPRVCGITSWLIPIWPSILGQTSHKKLWILQYCKDILNLYNIPLYVLTWTLLSSINPFPSMHSLLVTIIFFDILNGQS